MAHDSPPSEASCTVTTVPSTTAFQVLSFFLLCVGRIYGVLITSIFYLLMPCSCKSTCYREPNVLPAEPAETGNSRYQLDIGPRRASYAQEEQEKGRWIHHPLATAVLFDSHLSEWFSCILGWRADWEGVVLMEINACKSANQPQELLPITTSKIQVSRGLRSKPSSYMQRHFKHFWRLVSKIYGYSEEYLLWRLQASA